MSVVHLLTHLPPDRSEEVMEELLSGRRFRVERIVSHGHVSPPGFWYDQAWHEWVLVLQGAARIVLAEPDETVALGPGDALLIPAHRRHRVDWTDPEQPTVWLAIHFD